MGEMVVIKVIVITRNHVMDLDSKENGMLVHLEATLHIS